VTQPAVRSGVDVLAHLLVLRQELDQRDGLRTATMVSGYPGSPLGTFDLVLDRFASDLDAHQVVHRPGLNEELAAATVWGSQMGAVVEYDGYDGVVGAWYGKTPGLDRSGDVLKHANAMGAGPNGGVVLFCGDDPSAKSSTLPCDSQPTFEDACIPVLFPGNQQEVLDLGIHAFRLSRYAGPWVGLKVVTTVADGIGSVDLDLARHRPEDPPGEWHHHPLTTIGPHAVPDQEALVVEHRLRAAREYVRHNGLDRVVGAPAGARLGVVCAGKTYYDVLQAFDDLGVAPEDVGVRVLKLAMTYPLVEETALEFAASVDQVVVVEEKRPFVERQLRAALHEAGCPTPVAGKRATGLSTTGELDAGAIAKVLGELLPDIAAPAAPKRIPLQLAAVPGRAPGFCSGCPHNRSTVAPEGALVGGGVGCHGIMYFEARNTGMKRLPPTPMGAEGVPWLGLQPFVAEPHLIQNLGDGTLSHSGSLAIRAAVAAKADITFKVLYNAAVAMTGGQEVQGLLDVPSLTRALEAEGVARIVVCAEEPKRYGRKARWAQGVEVHHRDHLPQVQEELRGVPGVSVIVYDQRCAAEARRLRKRGLLAEPDRRVVINEAVCEGCGDCSTKSNCLSVLPLDTEMGVKRQIHDLSCNRDYTCLDGDCPSFVTLRPAKRGRVAARAAAAARPTLPPGDLPMPVLPSVERQFGVYFTGIGGTGVITANRLIAGAAEGAGLVVGGMDQTGLSQKAGAVVSHLHLAVDERALGSAIVSPAGADLYLSGDILQAAADQHLAKVHPRTVAVVDATFTPTAGMLQLGADTPDVTALRAAIEERVGAAAFVPSQRIAEAVFANHLLANVVLLGAAFQLGGLPLALDQIEAAIDRQGKAAADNRAAFAWGRWAVHDPAAVAARIDGTGAETGAGSSIFDPSPEAVAVAERLAPPALVRRTAQVVDYQGPALAERFLALVDVAGSRSPELADAVVEPWFRLLTYKDEYEVARLHLKVDYDEIADELGIDGPYSVKYHLHPPVLRRLGLKKKLPMGKPYEVAFKGLQRMKKLRGTPLDVFGYDPDRRMERAVIDEYERLVRDIAADRSIDDATAVRLAESALTIKGYGPIKEASVDAWRLFVASAIARVEEATKS
jgi:indolepyruvate ferredoxin oxidoreductase